MSESLVPRGLDGSPPQLCCLQHKSLLGWSLYAALLVGCLVVWISSISWVLPTQWSLRAFRPLSFPTVCCLASVVHGNHRGRAPLLLHLSVPPKAVSTTQKIPPSVAANLGWMLNPLDHISSSFCLLKQLLSRSKPPLGFLPFYVGSLASSVLPSELCSYCSVQSRRQLLTDTLTVAASFSAQALAVTFPCKLSIFRISLCPRVLFIGKLWLISNNYTIDLLLCHLEISSAKEIFLFNSRQVLRAWGEGRSSFVRTSQWCSLA